MEDKQKETDAQILLRFIAFSAGVNQLVPPMLVLQEALHLLDIYRNNPRFHPSAKEYIDIAQVAIQTKTKGNYTNKAPGCLVAAATYILIHTDATHNEQEDKLALDIFTTLSEYNDIRFDHVTVGKTIQLIQEYKQTAPAIYNPFTEFDEIAKGKNFSLVNWEKLLMELDKYYRLFYPNYPYYMMLHGFLMQIEFPTRRADVLGYLKDAAEKILSPQRAKEFIEEAGWLVSLYIKINGRGFSHQMPRLWADRDLNEFAMLMETITPEDLVAIAQSMIEAKQITHERYGFIPHILRSEKYYGQIVTDKGFDFCRGLYYAEGAREWIISGEREDFWDLPSLDMHDLQFINQCYDLFINYHIKRIKRKYTNIEQRSKKESDYYSELLESLKTENKSDNKRRMGDMYTTKAYNSLFARLRDLINYVAQRLKEVKNNEEKESQELKPAKRRQKYCTYIVPNMGKTRDEIEEDLQSTSQKSAQRFARLLLNYERYLFLDFRGDTPAEIYEYMKGRYNLKYSAGNFTRYFSR